MASERESLKPIEGANRPQRRRLGLRDELVLAMLPTGTILAVLFLVEELSRQRLLFASLASSAFLIYLDPNHGTNSVRTLVLAHTSGASAGVLTYWVLGHGYPAAAAALVITILMMILFDAVHPPAISTTLGFAFREGAENDLTLFLLALGITAVLVVMQRASLWLMSRARRRDETQRHKDAKDGTKRR